MRKRLALGLVALLAAAAATFVAVRLIERRAEHRSHTVAHAIRRVTRLATVEASLSNWQLRRDTKDLFGFIPFRCEKTIAVFYRGKVAAGFDLDAPGTLGIEVTERGVDRRVTVRLPSPRILYTDVPAPEVVVADGSACNRLDAEDYARLHADAREAVQREALAGGILARAEAHARTLVEEVVRPLGLQADVRIAGPALQAAGGVER